MVPRDGSYNWSCLGLVIFVVIVAVLTAVEGLYHQWPEGIALAALLIASVAWYIAVRNERRIAALEAGREQEEFQATGKANLIARLSREAATREGITGFQHWLIIANYGETEAREVEALMDGKPVLEFPGVGDGEEIREVGVKASLRYDLGFGASSPKVSLVEISWSDDSGERGKYRNNMLAWRDTGKGNERA